MSVGPRDGRHTRSVGRGHTRGQPDPQGQVALEAELSAAATARFELVTLDMALPTLLAILDGDGGNRVSMMTNAGRDTARMIGKTDKAGLRQEKKKRDLQLQARAQREGMEGGKEGGKSRMGKLHVPGYLTLPGGRGRPSARVERHVRGRAGWFWQRASTGVSGLAGPAEPSNVPGGVRRN